MLAVFAMTAPRSAFAQDLQERTIRFGHLNNTDHPISMGVKKFAEIVTVKSGAAPRNRDEGRDATV
jgi:TRAP-type C4-dicarboxylate transport system substrate-binding protein